MISISETEVAHFSRSLEFRFARINFLHLQLPNVKGVNNRGKEKMNFKKISRQRLSSAFVPIRLSMKP